MLTLAELRDLCARIAFGDSCDPAWTLRCGEDDSALWIQWVFMAEDTAEGGFGVQAARKWRLSRHSTHDEVVKTAFAGVLLALEHEARERFTYRDVPIFHPHTDVEALVEVQQAKRHVKREEAKP